MFNIYLYFYFSLIRFLRLGTELQLTPVTLFAYADILSLLLISLTLLGSGWFYLFIVIFDKIKAILMNNFAAFCKRLAIVGIQNFSFFWIFEKLYRGLTLIEAYINLNNPNAGFTLRYAANYRSFTGTRWFSTNVQVMPQIFKRGYGTSSSGSEKKPIL